MKILSEYSCGHQVSKNFYATNHKSGSMSFTVYGFNQGDPFDQTTCPFCAWNKKIQESKTIVEETETIK